MRSSRSLSLLLLGILLPAGCVTQRITEPKRTASEELLISTAADRALAKLDVSSLKGRKVYLSTLYFDSLDKEYVIGTLRDVLFSNGALLVDDIKEAEIVVEARSGALSTDSSESLTGVPSMPLPIPFAGTIKTPEVAIFKTQKQDSTAKMLLLAYDAKSREHIMSSPSLVGRAYNNYYHLVGFIRFRLSDIPERTWKKWEKEGENTGEDSAKAKQSDHRGTGLPFGREF